MKIYLSSRIGGWEQNAQSDGWWNTMLFPELWTSPQLSPSQQKSQQSMGRQELWLSSNTGTPHPQPAQALLFSEKGKEPASGCSNERKESSSSSLFLTNWGAEKTLSSHQETWLGWKPRNTEYGCELGMAARESCVSIEISSNLGFVFPFWMKRTTYVILF